MIQLRYGQPFDSAELSELILSTAPILLPYLFGSHKNALEYLKAAATREDGQYSASRHIVAYDEDRVIGCFTLWEHCLSEQFYRQTQLSLIEQLTPLQVAHVISVNRIISNVFKAPTEKQVCIGHFAVATEYQGMGIAKKLLIYAIQKAKEMKKSQLVLDVDKDNNTAVTFYTGMKFSLVNETHFYPTKQTFYRMQYNIDDNER